MWITMYILCELVGQSSWKIINEMACWYLTWRFELVKMWVLRETFRKRIHREKNMFDIAKAGTMKNSVLNLWDDWVGKQLQKWFMEIQCKAFNWFEGNFFKMFVARIIQNLVKNHWKISAWFYVKTVTWVHYNAWTFFRSNGKASNLIYFRFVYTIIVFIRPLAERHDREKARQRRKFPLWLDNQGHEMIDPLISVRIIG